MILEVINISKEYIRAKKLFSAVSHVSFSSAEGNLIGITGPSGGGKSTLFHMISGLVKPTSGHVRLLDQEITDMSNDRLAELRRTDIGYILQGQNLLQNFTLMENICMPVYMGKRFDGAYQKGLELLDIFGLKGMENEYPSSLSGGEQRRISIIRAFIHSPKLVIADEPTSNLDIENASIIMRFFKRASEQKITILVSSHDIDLISSIATQKYKMINGELTLWK